MANPNNFTLKCPECNQLVARDPRGLATHRRFKHGVKGTSPAAIQYREAQARKQIQADLTGQNRPNPRKMARAKTTGEGYPCPECANLYKTHETLARHRLKLHNVPVNTREQRRELAKTTQDATQLSTTNGHRPSASPQDDGDHRIQAAATFASGRVAQLLESIALQHDLPYKPFAALVLRTVAHTAQVR